MLLLSAGSMSISLKQRRRSDTHINQRRKFESSRKSETCDDKLSHTMYFVRLWWCQQFAVFMYIDFKGSTEENLARQTPAVFDLSMNEVYRKLSRQTDARYVWFFNEWGIRLTKNRKTCCMKWQNIFDKRKRQWRQ